MQFTLYTMALVGLAIAAPIVDVSSKPSGDTLLSRRQPFVDVSNKAPGRILRRRRVVDVLKKKGDCLPRHLISSLC